MKLWIDPSFGASGDMFLGALIDLIGPDTGSTMQVLQDGLSQLNIDGYALTCETVTRNGIAANRVNVDAKTQDKARHWSEIDKLIQAAALPERVTQRSRSAFRRLGEVEANMHNVELADVHFHEVGAVDALVDIVGTCILVDALQTKFDVDAIVVGPVGLGSGTVEAAHGTLPLPAPATAALLEGLSVRSLTTPTETCTPTGATLLAEFANEPGPIPTGTLTKIARGAGGRNPSTHPNVLTLMLVQDQPESSAQPNLEGQPLAPDHRLLSTNIDDATPEVLAYTVERLLAEGADDAWLVPIVMKKGRPACELRVLCHHDRSAALRHVILTETGTLGIREQPVHKHVEERGFVTVQVAGHTVAMKVGPHGAKPEFDDLVLASTATSRSVRELGLEAAHIYRVELRNSKFSSDDAQ